ncbi:tripartite tricarboxylate transporter TctB family protein [Martelella mediterranea]|uniref:tripartite tricarboxylate transporter TctB family protein n=1 Tax=Martelella mediterranea TaxID=293089 RepID=UPI001E35DA06|nr:tripartite tricarboxylate transporter TctB family protein [Martelella mediterranea]MCD1633482.1 tripartite tricarboxylate transporter TctB family protein [Martelella mediterranea]
MSDRIFGGFGIVIAAIYIWQALLTQESFMSDPVGPKTFPIIIGVVLALASLFIILMPDAEPEWPKAKSLAEIAISACLLFAYAYFLPIAGFVIATMVAAGFLSWRLGAPALKAAIAGICISVGIYVVFHLVLGLHLATGPLGI